MADCQAQVSTRKIPILVFICIPVSPGKSRLIWSFPRNFAVWLDKIIPKWVFHLNQNLVLDSDLYLLHVQVLSTSCMLSFYTHVYYDMISSRFVTFPYTHSVLFNLLHLLQTTRIKDTNVANSMRQTSDVHLRLVYPYSRSPERPSFRPSPFKLLIVSLMLTYRFLNAYL